jgi:hypothetical protein
MPPKPVGALPPVTLPPPEVTVKVTVTPTTGFPLASVTWTVGRLETGCPTVPPRIVEVVATMLVGVPTSTSIAPEADRSKSLGW